MRGQWWIWVAVVVLVVGSVGSCLVEVLVVVLVVAGRVLVVAKNPAKNLA